MKNYLITACGAVFLSVIVSFIIPQGRLGKTITAVFRIVCIAILLTPVTNLFDITDSSYADYTDYQFICEVYGSNQSDALEQSLLEELNAETRCTVNIVYSDGKFSVESVEVCLLNGNEEIIKKIYEYLVSNDYINITVYEETNVSG